MAKRYYSGTYSLKNPSKYSGTEPHKIIFRSMWERCVFVWLENNQNVLSWSSEETIVNYISPVDGKPHRYFIDISMTMKCKDGSTKTFWVEIKPESQTRKPVMKKGKRKETFLKESITYAVNEAKWEAANITASRMGYEFVIFTEETMKSIGIKLFT